MCYEVRVVSEFAEDAAMAESNINQQKCKHENSDQHVVFSDNELMKRLN